MAEQAFQNQMGQRQNALNQIQGFAVHRAPPAHAGVHFHMNRQLPAGADKPAFERFGKSRVGNGRRQVVFDHVRNLRRDGGAQNDDGRFNAADPKLNALVGVGHAQHPRARPQGGVGYFNGAVAVGVGLHGLQEIHAGADQALNFAQIRGKSVQIHFHPAAVFLLVSRAHFFVMTNTPSHGSAGGFSFRFLHRSTYTFDGVSLGRAAKTPWNAAIASSHFASR